MRERLRPVVNPVRQTVVEKQMFSEESLVNDLHNTEPTARPTRRVRRQPQESTQKSLFDENIDREAEDAEIRRIREEREKNRQAASQTDSGESERETSTAPKKPPPQAEDVDNLDFWNMGSGTMNRKLPSLPKPEYKFGKGDGKKRKPPQIIGNLMKQRPRPRSR